MFCCIPSFALTEPEAFYDAFPVLKGRIGPKASADDEGPLLDESDDPDTDTVFVSVQPQTDSMV